MSSQMSPFPFMEMLEILKNTRRSGWLRCGVPGSTESVSDHMYRTAVMCCMAPGFDEGTRAKAMKMALIHDMGESVIGDITPYDGISSEEKKSREDLAIKFLACTVRLSNPEFADLVSELWLEYEEGLTRASQLVRQIDKLECIDQAILYEERSGTNLEEFMALQKHVTLPELQPWLERRLEDYQELKSRKKADTIVVFVSGGPGVGKGTQCTLAAQEFDFHHISVGDLLRQEAASATSPYGQFINESMEKSVLLPAQLTTYLLKQEMRVAQARGGRRFLIDGFPRSVDQAVSFDVKISDSYSTISLLCSEEALQERLEKRAHSSNRIDDDPIVVSRRLRTFQENNAPVLKHLQQRGPIYEVDCSCTIQDAYSSFQGAIRQILHL